MRALAAAAGRDPYDIKVFSGYGVITGETRAEARRKYDLYRSMTDPEGTLALWSGWLGFDLARYDLDDRLEVVRSDAIQSLAETFGDGDWKLRDIVDRLALAPDGPVAVGTGVEVADQIQDWVAATDADGLNVWHVITPGSYADFADYVVPELQRRGAYRTRYECVTLRHQLFGRGSRLPNSHPAAPFRSRVARCSANVRSQLTESEATDAGARKSE